MKISQRLFLTIICFLSVTLVSCQAEQSQKDPIIPTLAGYNLVWHDEFNARAIDPKIGNMTSEVAVGGNGELENYTSRPDNARIENGNLVIEARFEKYEGSYYTSARLKTQGLRDFQYGWVEARLSSCRCRIMANVLDARLQFQW